MTDYALPPTPSGTDSAEWRAAVAAIRGYCGWHISPSVTETVTVDGPGDGILLLPTLRLTAIASITDDGTAITGFEWSERGAVRKSATSTARWTTKYRGIVAEITHGYEEFPAELLAIARAMAAQGDGSLAKRLASGPHSIDLSDAAQAGSAAANPVQLQIIDRYRIPGRL